ncbi:MAG: CarD family transcriptional regulator [Desulfohalobiaceae bacterium]|nr:CarD family transcriptional regulator [Desulfohalobiaceae bacterium]
MFALNQLVVYPAQGVGKVEAVQEREMGGLSIQFYKIRILSNNGTLLIPVANASNVGLRKVCDPAYGLQLFEYLRDWSDFKGYAGQNWNRRYREYSDKLKTGDLADVAYVLKELMLISQDKDLSFGESRLMEQAMGLITMELAYTLERDQDVIRTEIEDIFSDILNKDT